MKVGFTLWNEAGCEVTSAVKDIKNWRDIKDTLVAVLDIEDWTLDDGDKIEISIIE